MDQFYLPYDNELDKNQLELPLTYEVTGFKKVLSELGTSQYRHPHIQMKPSWPRKPKLPPFR